MSPVPVSLPFTDRSAAGRGLAERVRPLVRTDPVVLALPPGGVPVGAELARALDLPLDVLVVRRLNLQGDARAPVGAVTEGGGVFFDDSELARRHVSRDVLSRAVRSERQELDRLLKAYRGGRPGAPLAGRDVVIVDEGVTTGATARAAVRAARRHHPARVCLAVPVASQAAVAALRGEADEIVVLTAPDNFQAVGEWYRDYERPTEADIAALLEDRADGRPTGRPVRVTAGGVGLDGDFTVPETVRGAAVMALGHGRAHAQQRAAADALHDAGYALLALDLFTPEEWESAQGAPDVGPDELGERLARAVEWLRSASGARGGVGIFGAGAAAPAAPVAAARMPGEVGALAVLGGRIDLAGDELPQVRVPALVMVPGGESFVWELSEWAAGRMSGPVELRAAPGAEQLLGGTAEGRLAGEAAAEWFDRHL
ncbi:phosphoribosyltransferase family protein [Nocardiopsis sp. RSe5-2]|uniref:Phosphoribosyltransferase family protein n=1 Tax=Nocardiopsis endophytica TaxID=3018445 RepID=A0ABT4UDK8_9ACTN|nr:phosphoribosyltransferase family protein [Nocardiopsis endophytica]MDA2815072.1 phosphoribosyltransferase family protein [Nocardiopsis endophytica]